ncbi:MAG TPA: hypothetical protein VG015_10135 [Candidatus Dormibacteraeota bacterium]|nr:hypothetical protein [Candidatus Dormibacteraeota bacterium]
MTTYRDAPPGTAFANPGNGPVIGNVDVQIVFWGREWGGAPPVDPAVIRNSVYYIVNGPYMSRLTQYGCNATGRIRGVTFVTNSDPPKLFKDADVSTFVIGLIDNETLPEPDADWDMFVAVFMPTYSQYGPGGAAGAHGSVLWSDYDLFDVDNDRARFAWIGNPGNIDSITTTFSHELVEACTDPDPFTSPAWRQTPCSNPTLCEIGDVCRSTARVNGVQVQAYWSVQDNSCVIPTNGPVFPPPFPGARLAASRQFGLDQTDVFVVDNNGALNVRWAVGADPWWGPLGITRPGFAPPGAALAVSQQFGLEQTDVFVVDNTGALNVVWAAGATRWRGPQVITKPDFAPPGAAVAASRQFGLEQTDVFVVDNSGAVNLLWARAGAPHWEGPKAITEPKFAPPGAAVAASRQFGLDQTDVFVVDNTGAVNVLWVTAGGNRWRGPQVITKPKFAPPGASVAVSQQFGLDQTDVFVIDNTGALYGLWATAGAPHWEGPQIITKPNFAPAGGAMAASRQFGLDQTDVFVVDNAGALNVVWAAPGAPRWAGPKAITKPKFAPAGAAVAASRQFGLEQTDVFVVGNNQALNVLWAVGRNPWSVPVPTTFP